MLRNAWTVQRCRLRCDHGHIDLRLSTPWKTSSSNPPHTCLRTRNFHYMTEAHTSIKSPEVAIRTPCNKIAVGQHIHAIRVTYILAGGTRAPRRSDASIPSPPHSHIANSQTLEQQMTLSNSVIIPQPCTLYRVRTLG